MITAREIHKLVEEYIGTDMGYLKNFSYNKHDEFYLRYCDLDVDVPAYRDKHRTTRKAFIAILKDLKPRDQAKVIRGVFEMLPPDALPAGGAYTGEASGRPDEKKLALHQELLAVAARLESDGQVLTPIIEQTSETVLEALRDSEVLLSARGPTSAVDRAHTALHGYLKKLCTDRNISMPSDPSLTAVFKVIREQFSEFSAIIPHDNEAKRVFGSIANALDSLNSIRNRATLAHPNDLLLNEAEAMLYINLSRAVLGYIDTKLRQQKQ